MAASLPSPASSSPNSPSSTDGPLSPSANSVQTLALPPPVDASPQAPPANPPPAQPKRKPSRRANTAERRATHNAVERARRETLNSRFLDLAALLPNLSQIRRPSKSSIVNSSIAHIHASRRHRLLAARELRLLKLETDALRRELNEWRDRSGLPRVEEPLRGEAFQMILSGEVEVVNPGPIEEEDAGEYGPDDYPDDDFVQPPMIPTSGARDQVGDVLARPPDVTPFAHNVAANNGSLHLQSIVPRPANHGPSPMIVQSPTSVSFENPAMAAIYESNPMQLNNNPSYFMNSQGAVIQRSTQNDVDKVSAWNAQMYGIGQQQHQQQQFTPPTSSHGPNGSSPINVASQQAAYIMNLQRQQAMLPPSGPLNLAGHPGYVYGSPIDGDDASSVGSAPGNNNARRERSGSMNSVGSGYTSAAGGSPPGASISGGFDLPGMINSTSAGGVPRRMGSGMGMGQWDDGMTGMTTAGGLGGIGGGMGGLLKSTQQISVGGGGNGHGFAAMMM